jgi:hypothetical protein
MDPLQPSSLPTVHSVFISFVGEFRAPYEMFEM